MMSILRKYIFKKNSNQRINERVYDRSDYDETYVSLKNLLQFVAIRMTHNISERTTKWWDTIYWFEFLNLLVILVSETVSMGKTTYQAQTFRDSVIVFRMIPCYGTVVLFIFKSIKLVVHRPVYENLVNELRSMWPQGEVSEEEHRIIRGSIKQLNFLVKGYYWCNNALLLIYLYSPFLNTLARYLGQDRAMALHYLYWLPFDPYQSVYYEIMLLVQTWHGLVVVWLNVAWDMLFCTFLGHISMQFDLLARRVRRLFYVKIDQQLVRSYPLAAISEDLVRTEGEGLELNSNQYWDVRCQKELTDIVLRHRALIRLAGDVEKISSFSLLINFFNSSIIICFCGFCSILLEKWNVVVYKSFLGTALAETWLLCWYGQTLIDSSTGLSGALYNCGWYNGSKRVKTAVMVMLHRAQGGVYVTTCGFSVISLSSFSTIIKTSWSYLTLLLNFFKDKSID